MDKVYCLYNTDYDDELTSEVGVDISSVEKSAKMVSKGVEDSGRSCKTIGLHGKKDILRVLEEIDRGSPDLIFNVVESLNGTTKYEALMPYMYELFDLPYTGSSGQSISLCLHKDQSKDILIRKKIATPPSLVFTNLAEFDDPSLQVQCDHVGFPLFLKLASEDASIGICEANVCMDILSLRKRGEELLLKYRQPVLCEKYIEGREVNVMLLGNGRSLEVLPLHEIDFSEMPMDRPRIISYAAKWDESHVDYKGTKPVPMKNVSMELQGKIEAVAKDTFAALGLRDYGRVDLRIDHNENPWVIDVNPNCDISPDSGAARCAQAHGLDYPAFIGKICELALARVHDEHPKI